MHASMVHAMRYAHARMHTRLAFHTGANTFTRERLNGILFSYSTRLFLLVCLRSRGRQLALSLVRTQRRRSDDNLEAE